MDTKTLFVVLVSVFMVQAVGLYQSWLQNREEIGTRDWAVAAILMSIGSVIAAFALYHYATPEASTDRVARDVVLSIGNTFGACGWFMVWVGVKHFYRREAPGYWSLVLFGVLFTALMLAENVVNLPVAWHSFCVSLSFSVFAGLSLFEVLKRNVRYSGTAVLLSMMLLVTVVVWFTRAMIHLGIAIPGVTLNGIYIISLYDAIVASVTVTVSMILLTNERINGKLMELALKDPLTGAMNRRAFHDSSRAIFEDDSRCAGGYCICLIDLDNFKMVNDNYGHATGDLVLSRFSHLAMSTLRDGDLFARYGGEEFVVLLKESTIKGAEETMNRLRKAWEQEAFEVDGGVVRSTISAGVVQFAERARLDLDKVLDHADKLLYQAKEAGRNRVECAAFG